MASPLLLVVLVVLLVVLGASRRLFAILGDSARDSGWHCCWFCGSSLVLFVVPVVATADVFGSSVVLLVVPVSRHRSFWDPRFSSSSRHYETRLSIAQLCGVRPLQLPSQSLPHRVPKHRGMTPTWSRHGAADRVAKAASDGSRWTFSSATGFSVCIWRRLWTLSKGYLARRAVMMAVSAAANVDAKPGVVLPQRDQKPLGPVAVFFMQSNKKCRANLQSEVRSGVI